MEKLTERELVPLIKALTQPVLGICLGMQLLGSFSEEGQSTVPLLGLIDSPVQKWMPMDFQFLIAVELSQSLSRKPLV